MLIVFGSVFLTACREEPYRQKFCYETISVVLDHDFTIYIIEEHMIGNNKSVYDVITITYFLPNLQLANIKHMNAWTTDNVRRQLNKEFVPNPVNISTHRISLQLTLSNPGRQNILNAVAYLNTRSDVFGASVNGFIDPPGS